jgi:nucleotide-binding universal stress UspA family protein
VRGSVAWKLLAKSTVPVLLRHAEDDPATQMGVRRGGEIMIPLDGSAYAEKVIPMAKEFALEWGSRLNLVRIVPNLPVAAAPYSRLGPVQYDYTEDVHLSERYLDRIANSLVGEVRTIVRVGGVVNQLVTVASELSMSHIFLASHGRTGLQKMIVGSVADSLIQCLHLPIIVLPALANGRLEEAPQLEKHKSLVYA